MKLFIFYSVIVNSIYLHTKKTWLQSTKNSQPFSTALHFTFLLIEHKQNTLWKCLACFPHTHSLSSKSTKMPVLFTNILSYFIHPKFQDTRHITENSANNYRRKEQTRLYLFENLLSTILLPARLQEGWKKWDAKCLVLSFYQPSTTCCNTHECKV